MTGDPRRTFARVDDGDVGRLVAMMDATDAWPAVRAARDLVLTLTAGRPAGASIDLGCGPGTFHAADPDRHLRIDLDRSAAMLGVVRARRPGAVAVRADADALPFRSRRASRVHAERVLQWTPDPVRVIDEMVRVAAPGGWVAVTDTDWSTLAVEHPDPAVVAGVGAAALRWVPHPTVARDVAGLLSGRGLVDVLVHTERAEVVGWDPDDDAERDGPPGLPVRTIAPACADPLADEARRGRFRAALTLVTTVARLPGPGGAAQSL